MSTVNVEPSFLHYLNVEKVKELGLLTSILNKESTPKLEEPIQQVQGTLFEKLEALKYKLPAIRPLRSKSPQRQLFQ